MNQTLDEIVQGTLKSVRVVARTKDFGEARRLIKEAERTAGEVRSAQALGHGTRTDEEELSAFLNTMKETYGVYFDEAIQAAQRYAQLGDVGHAVDYLLISRDFGVGSGMTSEEKWSQIMDIAYKNGVEFELQHAERDAKTGYFYGSEKYLQKARQYALESKTEFPEARAEQIMATACRNGIELYLNGAEESAKRGDALMWAGQSDISYAKDAARRIGVDIAQRVKTVKSLFKK